SPYMHPLFHVSHVDWLSYPLSPSVLRGRFDQRVPLSDIQMPEDQAALPIRGGLWRCMRHLNSIKVKHHKTRNPGRMFEATFWYVIHEHLVAWEKTIYAQYREAIARPLSGTPLTFDLLVGMARKHSCTLEQEECDVVVINVAKGFRIRMKHVAPYF